MTILIGQGNDTQVGATSGATRREFLKRFGAAGAASAALLVIGAGVFTLPAGAAPAMPAYRIDYPAGVRVSVGDGKRYEVVVKDEAGQVLETHRGMNSAKLQRTTSQYFTVTGIMAPTQ